MGKCYSHPSFHSLQWHDSQTAGGHHSMGVSEEYHVGLRPVAYITASSQQTFFEFLLTLSHFCLFLICVSWNQLFNKLSISKTLSQGLILGRHRLWNMAYNILHDLAFTSLSRLFFSVNHHFIATPTCFGGILIPRAYHTLSNFLSLCTFLPTP